MHVCECVNSVGVDSVASEQLLVESCWGSN